MIRNNQWILYGTLIAALSAALPAGVSAQGLPEGEGRDKVIMACSGCHGLDNIFNASNEMSAADWEFYVYEMISRGAPVLKDDIDIIKDYLIKNYTTKK